MVDPHSVYASGKAGLELHATVWANPGRPVCILLHGFSHDSRVWDPLASALQRHYEVIALDFRGHGRSGWDLTGRYCHDTLLEDLKAIIEQLRPGRFHLLGHSLGARVAMLYTAAQPDRVLSLGILDTGPEVGDRGANRIRQEAENTPSHFDSRQNYFEWLCQRHPLAIRESMERMAEHGVRQVDGHWQPRTDPGFARALWRHDASGGGADDLRQPLTQELWDCLEAISCRTLVLRGQISSILKRDVAQTMVELLAQGVLDSAPMAGHAVMLDNPDYCIEAISAFLATVDQNQAYPDGYLVPIAGCPPAQAN